MLLVVIVLVHRAAAALALSPLRLLIAVVVAVVAVDVVRQTATGSALGLLRLPLFGSLEELERRRVGIPLVVGEHKVPVLFQVARPVLGLAPAFPCLRLELGNMCPVGI